jgi:LEA14-like dessication related protein
MPIMILTHRLWLLLLLASSLLLGGCASLPESDPLQITVAGISPLEGQNMELRLIVKLRVQNPNDLPIEYHGVSLTMDVQGKTFASGVSDATGTVPRYGEAVLEVPVTISALRMARQALGMATGGPIRRIDYEMRGKLAGGTFRSVRFATTGSFDLPSSATPRE